MDGSPESLCSSNEENSIPDKSLPKVCQVCGDKAKSHHFGGLCCESCKAFFRRSMQNDCFKSFFCINGQKCVIGVENRRSCQYCRVQKCFSIGMEKGWLRTDEEINKMRELKLVNNSQRKQAVAAVPVTTCAQSSGPPSTERHRSVSTSSASPVGSPYEPKMEDIYSYLSQEDVKLIENIVQSYWHAYRQIPFGPEVTQNSAPRTGLQVISMFTTGIRRWAMFSRSMLEFASLCRQDQAALLQAAVMQLSILRAVASFRMNDREWRINTPVNQYTPSLTLEDVQRLLSPQLAEMHLAFISSMHRLNVDEPIIMMLSILTLFTAERADLVDRPAIAKTQDNYIMLLKRYCDWKYGPDDCGRTFANLLAKLSDLRELSDVHSDHQVRFANQDLQKLYQEIDSQPMAPHVNMDLNETGQFLSAMEFSISKTHQTLPAPAPTDYHLEQIEDLCANLQHQSTSGATANTAAQLNQDAQSSP